MARSRKFETLKFPKYGIDVVIKYNGEEFFVVIQDNKLKNTDINLLKIEINKLLLEAYSVEFVPIIEVDYYSSNRYVGDINIDLHYTRHYYAIVESGNVLRLQWITHNKLHKESNLKHAERIGVNINDSKIHESKKKLIDAIQGKPSIPFSDGAYTIDKEFCARYTDELWNSLGELEEAMIALSKKIETIIDPQKLIQALSDKSFPLLAHKKEDKV
jgi:hypothetical protein